MTPRIFKLKRLLGRLILAGLVVFATALLSQSREISQLEIVQQRGTLRLVTRQGPITYYVDAKGKTGFEYLLARDFARHLGVELQVTTVESLAQVFNMLGGPNADFAGATLTITPERRKHYRFSAPYDQVEQTVVYRRGTEAPDTIADIQGRPVAVVGDSSHEERLQELKVPYPDLQWTSFDGVEMIELIEMVNAGEIDFAVVDSTTFEAHRTMYPNTASAFDITEPQPLAWAFPDHGDRSLIRAANRFLADTRESGRLAQLKEQFFSDIEHFSVAGALLFLKRVETRLPRFLARFQRTARELGMDWHLLAAIAYQESHWDPEAVSPTGVKGLMMLTRDTASEMNIDDRQDPAQSIRGGAAYFLDLKSRLPGDIDEPDRTWFALAAYNVGLGHLEDARVLTDRAGRDPHLWSHVRKFLPLLQRKKYYTTVRYGYARGREPVIYVRNVRKYTQLLQWNTIEANRRDQRRERQLPSEVENWSPHSFRTL